MPKALGEFGRAKNSGAAHKIVQVLSQTDRVLSVSDLWKSVSSDLDKIKDLGDIVQSLCTAGKIQAVAGGFLPVKRVVEQVTTDLLDYSLLTDEERKISI